MTTWKSPRLPAGVLNTPLPTILIDDWKLTARTEPHRSGFTRIRSDRHWHKARPTTRLTATIVDDGLFICHTPTPLPTHHREWTGHHFIQWLVQFDPDEAWYISLGLLRPDDQFHHDIVRAGTVLIATAPLHRYWDITATGTEVTFSDLRQPRNWAAQATLHPTML